MLRGRFEGDGARLAGRCGARFEGDGVGLAGRRGARDLGCVHPESLTSSTRCSVFREMGDLRGLGTEILETQI